MMNPDLCELFKEDNKHLAKHLRFPLWAKISTDCIKADSWNQCPRQKERTHESWCYLPVVIFYVCVSFLRVCDGAFRCSSFSSPVFKKNYTLCCVWALWAMLSGPDVACFLHWLTAALLTGLCRYAVITVSLIYMNHSVYTSLPLSMESLLFV